MAELIIFLMTRVICIITAGVVFWEPLPENATVNFNKFNLRTIYRSSIRRWRAVFRNYQGLGQMRWFPKLT